MTSVPPAPPGAGERGAGLAVRVTVDDQFSTSPTAIKTAVTVLLLAAVAVVLAALRERDRAARAARWEAGDERHPRPRPRVVDAVVPGVLFLWTFIGPMTDDDGYYAAMAANVPYTGYVANYYQLYNQGFTPFTWIYYALSWWQGRGGREPRRPTRTGARAGADQLVPPCGPTWPVPFPPGQGVAAAPSPCTGPWPWCSWRGGCRSTWACAPRPWWPRDVIASMLCLAVALERDRWALAGLAVVAASFGATAAPTGFVALAPLLACLPAVWRLLGEEGRWTRRLGAFRRDRLARRTRLAGRVRRRLAA